MRYNPSIASPNKPRGFALIVAISLLAFILILVVTLATLVELEHKVASSAGYTNEAEQNALFALQEAIGELQKYAGPDQRVTATADILASQDKFGNASPTSSGIAVQNGARYWMGVWGNGDSLANGKTSRYDLRPDEVDGDGVDPIQLNWLVSGNTSASYSVNASDGSVSKGNAPSYTPSSVISLPTNADAMSTELTIQSNDGGDSAAVLLVGAGSVTDGFAQDYIVAPKLEVPGNTNAVSGRYAWWVGDEGVKARINLINGYQDSGQDVDRINSFITSQRSSVQSMDRDQDGNTIGSDIHPGDARVQNLSSGKQLPLLASDNSAESRLQEGALFRFHDLTSYSSGVLADAYNGGLKKDLTADIADTSNDTSYRPSDSAPIFAPLSSNEVNLPTWGHLRSWARTQAIGGTVAPVPPTDTEAGIYPIVQYASLGMSTYVDTFSSNTIHLSIYPVVVLSNPYSVAIDAADYDISFQFRAGACLYYRTAPESTGVKVSAGDDTAFTTVATFDIGTFDLKPGEWTPEALEAQSPNSVPVSFRIEGSIIPPGETHIYVLDASQDGQNYQPGRVLRRAPDSSFIGTVNRLELSPAVAVTIPTVPEPDERKLVVFSENVSRTREEWPGDTFRVNFAEAGGLGSPSQAFQSFEMMMSELNIRPAGNRIFQATNENLPIADWSIDPGLATAAFRLGTALDARYTFADLGQSVGMAPSPFKAWLRSGNLRAPYSLPTFAEAATISGGPVVIGGHRAKDQRAGSMVTGALLANPIASTSTALLTGNNRYTANLAGIPQASTPPRYATYFDVLDSPDRLLSLGQLQHVPFSRYSFYSSYPFGNSVADVHIDRTTTYRLGLGTGTGPGVGSGIVLRPGDPANMDPAYDLSWHLNRALWDRYYVSGVPTTWTQASIDAGLQLPNNRMRYASFDGSRPDIDSIQAKPGLSNAYDEAAANLMVTGAFNVNSTSEQAWRAVLAGTLGLPHDDTYSDTSDTVEKLVPFPRFSRNLERTGNSPYAGVVHTMATNLSNERSFYETYFHGNRGLFLNDPAVASQNASAEAVVNELASKIVQEVRRRGPFLSMAQFVNRPILQTRQSAGIKGALQAAIDSTESPGQVNPMEPVNGKGRIITNSDSYRNPYPSWDDEHYIGGANSEVGTGRDAFRLTSAFAPKYLTQADILSTLGPMLTVRSDTFIVRAYGESLNPLTRAIEGRAWCEAVVQRIPEYTDVGTNPNAWEESLGINSEFGRKFVVVSFRWLTPSEI